MQEKARRTDMVKSFLRAQIIYNKGMVTVDCLVKNISSGGARITINESIFVPTEFDLFIFQRNKTYQTRMAWRNATAIGVEFVLPQAQSETKASETPIDVLHSRLRALEIQNAELKVRVRDLSKRLENLGQEPDLFVF